VLKNVDYRVIRENRVNLLLGDFRGRGISEKEKIPLVRTGFPVCDRFGYHRRAMVGYAGA